MEWLGAGSPGEVYRITHGRENVGKRTFPLPKRASNEADGQVQVKRKSTLPKHEQFVADAHEHALSELLAKQFFWGEDGKHSVCKHPSPSSICHL